MLSPPVHPDRAGGGPSGRSRDSPASGFDIAAFNPCIPVRHWLKGWLNAKSPQPRSAIQLPQQQMFGAPCTKTAQACGKAPRIRPAVSLPACETGGMQKRAKPRWSLPYRLRSEGWWLVDPPRANPTAILIPFVRKSLPAMRPAAIRKVRS
ncbi:hypothetical protein MesoLj113c_10220 [Mesorhizobium sp. 113-3-9]|nr:hypothetical protein MesoLj113c_10220 [Mesorhizobium sp. 113-3-9]